MSIDVEEQLRSYFTWLEQDCGQRMWPTLVGAPAGRPGPRRGRRAAWILAAAAVAAATLVVVVALSTHHRSTNLVSVTEVPSSASLSPASQPTPSVAPTSALASSTTDAGRTAVQTVAIGESVMQGAATALAERGVVVDAQESIQGRGVEREAIALLQTYDATNVVIQTGTNGPVTQEQYDAIADALATVPHVYFLTVKGPLAWVPANNESIRALPQRHANVSVIDWQAVGASIESELSPADGGIHLNSETAVQVYVDMIMSAISTG